jgi:hypothetical protein
MTEKGISAQKFQNHCSHARQWRRETRFVVTVRFPKCFIRKYHTCLHNEGQAFAAVSIDQQKMLLQTALFMFASGTDPIDLLQFPLHRLVGTGHLGAAAACTLLVVRPFVERQTSTVRLQASMLARTIIFAELRSAICGFLAWQCASICVQGGSARKELNRPECQVTIDTKINLYLHGLSLAGMYCCTKSLGLYQGQRQSQGAACLEIKLIVHVPAGQRLDLGLMTFAAAGLAASGMHWDLLRPAAAAVQAAALGLTAAIPAFYYSKTSGHGLRPGPIFEVQHVQNWHPL